MQAYGPGWLGMDCSYQDAGGDAYPLSHRKNNQQLQKQNKQDEIIRLHETNKFSNHKASRHLELKEQKNEKEYFFPKELFI